MNRYDFKWLKSQITIGQVLKTYGLDQELYQKNDYLFGPCPLHHGDNKTAFRVNLSKGVWNCFTHCGGGDIVELIRIIERCSYAQAAHVMNRLIENAAPVVTHMVRSKNAFQPFTHKLSLNPKCTFLQQHKKISIQTASTYESGIATSSKFLKNMIAVRLFDLNGKPLGYCGRRLDPQEIKTWGKWRFPNNFPKSSMLFNAHRAESSLHKGIILVECPWAAIRLAQSGVKNSVAILGTSLSKQQIQWISKATKVLLIFDGDPAGRTASDRIGRILERYLDVIVYHLHDNLEPEDLTDQQLRSIAERYSFF